MEEAVSVGKVMKEMGGQADPNVNEILQRLLAP